MIDFKEFSYTTVPPSLPLFNFFLSFVFLSVVVVVAISWAAPAACGGSQARR